MLLYSYGYGYPRNHIGTVSIRPYAVYGTVLSPNEHAELCEKGKNATAAT